jgi:hypothetical protein
MRKLLISLLAVSGASAFAMSNNLFQEFDDQVSIGYGMNQANSTGFAPGAGNLIGQTNVINLEAERLLNNGVWIDINANMAFGAGPAGASPYANPSDYGVNGKVGYAFTMANQHLQITPYGMVGLNNNASSMVAINGVANPQGANLFAYTAGGGARIEYRANRWFLLFADQSLGYNWDQSGPLGGVMPQNNLFYTSTLGMKFNVVKNFQIGLRGYYTGYSPQASNAVPGTGGFITVPQAQNAFGGLVSVGLTY